MNLDLFTIPLIVISFLGICYGLEKNKTAIAAIFGGILIVTLIVEALLHCHALNVRKQYLSDFCVEVGESTTDIVYDCKSAKITYESYIKGNNVVFIIGR